jgi:hypothetical protein
VEGGIEKNKKTICNEGNVEDQVVYIPNLIFRILSKKSVNSVLNEKYLLQHLNHP